MEQNKIKSLAECKREVFIKFKVDLNHTEKVSAIRWETIFDEANAIYHSPENQQPAQPVEGDLEKVIKEIIDYGNAGKTVSSTDSHVSYLGKKCLKLLEQHQQPSAVQWLTDGDINKIFYSESDSFDAGDYSFSYLSKQGFINALNELRTRLTTANQVDPVEFSKWVLDQYTSTKIRYALNDRMTYKEDVVSWSKLTEIYITEKQNKA